MFARRERAAVEVATARSHDSDLGRQFFQLAYHIEQQLAPRLQPPLRAKTRVFAGGEAERSEGSPCRERKHDGLQQPYPIAEAQDSDCAAAVGRLTS